MMAVLLLRQISWKTAQTSPTDLSLNSERWLTRIVEWLEPPAWSTLRPLCSKSPTGSMPWLTSASRNSLAERRAARGAKGATQLTGATGKVGRLSRCDYWQTGGGQQPIGQIQEPHRGIRLSGVGGYSSNDER
jgi:hypothetical protein